jgi:hypothetical protein
MYCEKMAVTDMLFRQRAVTEFLVKEGNSAGVIYERFRGVYGDVCMGVSTVRRWVKHFKDGNTGHRRSAALWSTENCCNWEQQTKSRRVHQTRPKDNSQRNCTAVGVGHHAVQEILEYRKVCSRWVLLQREASHFMSYLAHNSKEWLGTALHPPYSPDLAPSDYHLFGRSWLRGAGTNFCRRGIFKILQRW